MERRVNVIVLEAGEQQESVVRRFEKGWIVRFMRGSSLLGKEVTVYTTLTGSEPCLWSPGNDHLSVYCDVTCEKAGAFKYSFTADIGNNTSGSGYFLVMPELKVKDATLPLDAISCQTHLTKLLGELPSWKNRLKVSSESGYNMIHLTPIQELGISNSCYSLSDHHALNSTVHAKGSKATFDDIDQIVKEMETDWGILTVQDVVWNHAAKNAKWLLENPDSAYTCYNSPHLRPAYVVDRVYRHFGREVGEGVWESRGVPAVVDNIHQLHAIEYLLRAEILPKIRLHEFFQVDVELLVEKFWVLLEHRQIESPCDAHLDVIDDPEWRRFGRTIDFEVALKIFNVKRPECPNEDERRSKCVHLLRENLEYLNAKAGEEAWGIIMAGLNSVIGHITYERIADHGPRKGAVTVENPLTTDYFLHLEPSQNWEEDEKLAFDDETSKFLMAFNGWIMSSNPLVNFALKDSQVYLRRELVCWGDSVKLNYGEKEEDSPFLWKYMLTYTQQCAKLFHGLRIDNAHGTPIHVAEKMILAAREIRPDIYVFAELFTGSEHLDNIFEVKEPYTEAQSAGDSFEQGRLVYRYGGDCVGAMVQKSTRLSTPSIAHGLFLDQSHDNPSPILTRSVFDLLPTAAMVSMASCAIGSTRGYDEFVRHHIHVVTEKRLYSNWGKAEEVSADKGIIKARRLLNDLHAWLAVNGYNQVFVDQMNDDIVGITRHNPNTHETVVLVAHTSFNKDRFVQYPHGLRHIPIGGVLTETLFEMKLEETSKDWGAESTEALVGLPNYKVNVREHVQPESGSMYRLVDGVTGYIELTEFPTGAVVAFKIRLADEARKASDSIHGILQRSDLAVENELKTALKELSLKDFNRLLFSCEAEDQTNIGHGGYDVPGFGKFVYCGLQGLVHVLDKIRVNNDLGHPFCQNLRDGTWLCDYIVQRTSRFDGLAKLSPVLEKAFSFFKSIPYYLRPRYFEAIFSFLYRLIRETLLDKLNAATKLSNVLYRGLAMSTVAFVGDVAGAGLAPLATSATTGKAGPPCSLAAGLPHFATGIWRNWGRDTFIALPGCLLHTCRFEDARLIILSYAGSMRHGLIPNLLAEGIGARFNCRDAVWFWLLSVVKYVELAPNGLDILKQTVCRIYPNDDTKYGEETKEEFLIETMLEAIDRHFEGINFRERNAGSQIDEHMKDEGFNVETHVDRTTGFVVGGNRWNCGTWMDKMGSSEKAGNRGEPATPRDGAAVEIQALAFRVLSALQEWSKNGTIQRTHVRADKTWTWKSWAEKIKSNFGEKFYVGVDCQEEFVNRRCIVKDSVGSSLKFSDYQLRCNFAIALATAPDIIDGDKAWAALDTAKVLLGPIGIKTLDPSDWAYRGNYDNDNDGFDKATAKGWNYHQGPEWVWVAAFYCTARLSIGQLIGGDRQAEAVKEVQSRLGMCYKQFMESPWRSLPELTNENGEFCHHSCPAQAWSVGCLIETCHKLSHVA